MNVTVLYGGPGAERQVSLISGPAVIAGLRAAGHEVFGSDVCPDDLAGLEHPADVIFPVLHGAFGESGELQEILEEKERRDGTPFVGSGSAASRLGINKVHTKMAWEKAGLPTPQWAHVKKTSGAAAPFAPCVVKAVDSGSSIDVFLCKTMGEARAALAEVLGKHGQALVERLIEGAELTVGILEEEALAPIRVVPKREFFDFTAKYQDQGTEHRFDLGLPEEVGQEARRLALAAHEVVGCRDLSRVDMMVDKSGRAYLLEINTLPGFTPVSLLPDAARHAGIEFSALVDRLARRAAGRRRA